MNHWIRTSKSRKIYGDIIGIWFIRWQVRLSFFPRVDLFVSFVEAWGKLWKVERKHHFPSLSDFWACMEVSGEWHVKTHCPVVCLHHQKYESVNCQKMWKKRNKVDEQEATFFSLIYSWLEKAFHFLFLLLYLDIQSSCMSSPKKGGELVRWRNLLRAAHV